MKFPTFYQSAPYTIGVELEFQILDSDNLNLASRAPELINEIPEQFRKKIKPEFYQAMVEINTAICNDMAQVEQDLTETCGFLESLTAKLNCCFFSASLHPFARYMDQELYPDDRYRSIMDDLQHAGRRLISQGLHVHIGLPDGETAVRVCDDIRPFLPILLALTTSSPFYQGEDTGFYSYRTKLFDTLPRSGIPDRIGNWSNFKDLMLMLKDAEIISGIREIWWDVRPHPDFGTIEIRLCDLPARLDEILGITALIQALVAGLAQGRIKAPDMKKEIILTNKWQAARYGLKGKYVDPAATGQADLGQAADELLEAVRLTAKELSCIKFLAAVKKIIKKGTSAHCQKSMYAENYKFKAIIEKLKGDFWK